jgi:hypothetical protein
MTRGGLRETTMYLLQVFFSLVGLAEMNDESHALEAKHEEAFMLAAHRSRLQMACLSICSLGIYN